MDEIERLQAEVARLEREITRITRGDVSPIITSLGDALTRMGQLEHDLTVLRQQDHEYRDRTDAVMRDLMGERTSLYRRLEDAQTTLRTVWAVMTKHYGST